MSSSAYYSLIQWCPDAGRMETVNIGLVLVGPTRTKSIIRIQATPGRIRSCLGANVDSTYLRGAIEAFETRFRNELTDVTTPEAVDSWSGRLGNDIVMTPCRGVAIETDRQSTFDEMFNRLVERKRVPAGPDRSRLASRLTRLLTRKELGLTVEMNKELPVPTIGSATIPFAIQADVLQLIKPIMLGPRALDDARYWRLLSEDFSTSNFQLLIVFSEPQTDVEFQRKRECEHLFKDTRVCVFHEECLEQFETYVRDLPRP